MSSTRFLLAALVSLIWPVFTAVAGQAPGQSAEAELQKFQGTWVLIAAEKDGRKVDSAQVKQSGMTVVGNKIELLTPHQHQDKIIATVKELDLTKNPKEIHWVRTTGPNAGTAMKAIYEFEGLDRYKICFDPAGAVVPRKFETRPGSGHICHTWKRVK